MNPAESWLHEPEPETTELLPAERTPCSVKALARAFRRAWSELFGRIPSDATTALLLAHWALETGWGKSSWNWNLGNIRPPKERGCPCVQIPGPVSEIIGGREIFFRPPERGSTFRAFGDVLEGVRFYLEFLHGRFLTAWPALSQGDPTAFAHALKLRGYYTASEELYRKTLESCFAKCLKILTDDAPETEPEEISDELRKVVQVTQFDYYQLLHGA